MSAETPSRANRTGAIAAIHKINSLIYVIDSHFKNKGEESHKNQTFVLAVSFYLIFFQSSFQSGLNVHSTGRRLTLYLIQNFQVCVYKNDCLTCRTAK
jgi:hypothetical protein